MTNASQSVLGDKFAGRAELVKRGKTQKGFSLLEMLVAMVVLSLSLGALYQAAVGATRNVRVGSEYTEAVMLAESMMVDNSFVTEENYAVSGQFSDYSWQVDSWPVPSPDGSADDALAEQRRNSFSPLQYLRVRVNWPGGESGRQIELVTVVPLRSTQS